MVHVVIDPEPEAVRASVQALADVFSAFAAALGAADKVIELIQRLPKMPDPGGLKPSSFSGHLELKDVEFSYPSRPDTRVLGGVSLSVKPGEASHRFPWQPSLWRSFRPMPVALCNRKSVIAS